MGYVEKAFLQRASLSHWPDLRKCVEDEVFSEVDWHFARLYASSEEEGFFHAYLMAASRLGHLCIRIDENRGISPPPEILGVVDPSTLQFVKEKVVKGSFRSKKSYWVWDKDRCYLSKNWEEESAILHALKEISPPKPLFDGKLFDIRLKEEKSLNEQQKEAVQAVFDSPLLLVSGGPGTGKTFTASKIVQILASSLNQSEALRVALTAPTGKAALHLHSKISCEEKNVFIEYGTLHSLLGTFKRKKNYTDFDLWIVDEASMIDVKLMAHLFQAIKPGNRLVLMGDPDQLPPVEAGSLFYDLTKSASIHSVFLKTAVRFESDDLLVFSSAMKHMNLSKIQSLIKQKKSIDLIEWDLEERQVQNKIFEKIEPYFPKPCVMEPDPAELYKQLNRFRLLCALRKGYCGADFLNEEILKRVFSRGKERYWFAIPIFLTQNLPELDLYNGQAGLLVAQGKTLQGKVYLEDGRSFSSFQLPRYELGYCLSVHKSQGSEFDHVLLVLPKAGGNFGKELLYTAATRAKKRLEIIGNWATVVNCLKKESRRTSGILCRLERAEFIPPS
jgi:exodeoxyribonuclease V alpha subunit